jgi:hypothetical protein
MQRLWFLDIQRRGDAFVLKLCNVFDGLDDEEPIEVEVRRTEQVEEILRAVRPFARIPRRYMEFNGIASLLRVASLPKVPFEELLVQALAELELPPGPSVFVTPFKTREEISASLRAGR